MKALVILAALLAACAGTSAQLLATSAQQLLAGFSLTVQGAEPGKPARIEGFGRISPMGAAIDASVDAKLSYKAPLVLGGEPVEVWSRAVSASAGQRAYKVVFSGTADQQFVQVVRVTWAEARTWPGHADLPPPRDDIAGPVPETGLIPVRVKPPG